MAEELRALSWTGEALRLIDQTSLPGRLAHLEVRDVDGLVGAVQRLAVRGAPVLGGVGAYGVAIALLQGAREGWDPVALDAAIGRIREARPTAVNLAFGVDRVRPLIAAGVDAVVAEAGALVAEDVAACHAIGVHGAGWILARTARRPLRVLTHCNAGSLATCGRGTALGVIRELHALGALEMVYADETRPLLQGSRLTAVELAGDGIAYRLQADAAAAGTILRGLADVAIIGADRIAANGDTANKVGSLGVALACADAGIPFVVAAPWSTVDLATQTGDDIRIEERDEAEILSFAGVRVAPDGARAFNPAFDVTPARLITALATETGVLEPAAGRTPDRGLAEAGKAGRPSS
ncbi:S-methyl-5-thioribose-1-phosphate isomerase [Actinomadura scrupuli]|uniref:S-methyl-5-thioribose-1-phosphate isomerase n=1 Tax=Actinomadura scrupuli TaxID=559629 RepID=UPI003D97DFB1